MSKLEQIIGNREIAICKIGKFQEDFEYVFDTLKPVFYIDDAFEGNSCRGLPVLRTADILSEDVRGGDTSSNHCL